MDQNAVAVILGIICACLSIVLIFQIYRTTKSDDDIKKKNKKILLLSQFTGLSLSYVIANVINVVFDSGNPTNLLGESFVIWLYTYFMFVIWLIFISNFLYQKTGSRKYDFSQVDDFSTMCANYSKKKFRSFLQDVDIKTISSQKIDDVIQKYIREDIEKLASFIELKGHKKPPLSLLSKVCFQMSGNAIKNLKKLIEKNLGSELFGEQPQSTDEGVQSLLDGLDNLFEEWMSNESTGYGKI
jgi:hypothetical protein